MDSLELGLVSQEILKFKKMKKNFILLLVCFSFLSCRKDKVQPLPPEQCADTVFFSTQILPLVQNHCIGCHFSGNGFEIELTNHAQISSNADACFNSITESGGYTLMPYGGPKLSDSLIDLFNCWIVQGKQNN